MSPPVISFPPDRLQIHWLTLSQELAPAAQGKKMQEGKCTTSLPIERYRLDLSTSLTQTSFLLLYSSCLVIFVIPISYTTKYYQGFRYKSSLNCIFQDTRHMLASRPQLGYSGSGREVPEFPSTRVPQFPYQCDKQQCDCRFANPSSQLQHQEYFHKITSRMLAMR